MEVLQRNLSEIDLGTASDEDGPAPLEGLASCQENNRSSQDQDCGADALHESIEELDLSTDTEED